MSLNEWIETELAQDGLRLAEPFEPGATLEATSAGLVYAVPMPLTPDIEQAVRDWDAAQLYAKAITLFGVKPAPSTSPVTAQMVYDIWHDKETPVRDRQTRIASILSRLDSPAHERLVVDYRGLLRRVQHSRVSLVEVRAMFSLTAVLFG